MRRTRNILAALLLVSGLTGLAQAGLLPTSVTVLPESNYYRWTYSVVVPTDQYITAGDYFTIYDFDGMVGNSVQMPTGWTVSVNNIGKTPGLTTPVDDPNIPNLTFTYNGDPIFGQLGLGNFSAGSSSNLSADGMFTSRVHRSSDNKTEDTITFTDVPRPTAGTPPSNTPEPATVALLGIGLPFVGAVRLVRRKSR